MMRKIWNNTSQILCIQDINTYVTSYFYIFVIYGFLLWPYKTVLHSSVFQMTHH